MALRLDKRRAILDGALEVFGRDGYTRASIDMIAKAAGVSSRTIYNHFQDKATLFQVMIRESADRVATAQVALIDRYLHRVTDLEDDLTEFGLALTRNGAENHPSHFALVRQIRADFEHIPEPAIRAWREGGPLRVRRHLAQRLATLPGLRLDDPLRAALQFSALVSPDPTSDALAPDEEHVRSAVRVFLHGYGT